MPETANTGENAPPTHEPEVSADAVLTELTALVGETNVSNTELERIVYSGDPSALPQFHYRWKARYLADYVVRVTDADQVERVLAIAAANKLRVVPRGGASSCLGSSSPSRGGISLDIKRLNRILEVSQDSGDDSYVRVEPGVTFADLETELNKKGLELGIYPSSAKSAVIGGWIGCGGKAGIGTPRYGPLVDNLLQLKVVTPDGKTRTVVGEEIDSFNGSYGILGVIVEAKLRVRRKPNSVKSLSYGFLHLEHVCNAMTTVAKAEHKPIYLKIADGPFQSYSNPLEKGRYVLTITYNEEDATGAQEALTNAIADNGGAFVGEEYSEKEWELRYDCEFNPKEHTDTLMFQEVWIHVDKVYDILQAYERARKSHKVPSIWFGMLGHGSMMRLELMALLNPDRYLEFISSKGILHKMMKRAIKRDGGPYTIGLQNSIYMKKAYPERLQKMRTVKINLDPRNMMNPDRVVSCMTSYSRINVLFGLATAFRRLSKYLAR
jgi:FAD/FMN-containing dehydrogenase